MGNVTVGADMQAVSAGLPAAGKKQNAHIEEGLGRGHGPLGPACGCSLSTWSCVDVTGMLIAAGGCAAPSMAVAGSTV